MYTSLDLWSQNLVPSSNIGSLRSSRPGLQTSDAKSDFADLACTVSADTVTRNRES